MKKKGKQAFKYVGRILTTIFLVLLALPMTAFAIGELEMSTTYPGLTVEAGDAIDFVLDFYNGSGAGVVAELSAVSIPHNWEGHFTGNLAENNPLISHVHVRSGENNGIATFHVNVPIETTQGIYTITLLANSEEMASYLTLTLNVIEDEWLGGSALIAQFREQEGTGDTTFSFRSTIQNNTPREQSYSLSAHGPPGWSVNFRPGGEIGTHVSTITVDARGSQTIDVIVIPPRDAEAGVYIIPVSAISATETLNTEITVVITGTYSVSLSTPGGRLSFDAYANRPSAVTLSVTNNGNIDLQNINLTSSSPRGWTIEFSQPSIGFLEPGATQEITAFVTPAADALSGDYLIGISARTREASELVQFRVTVRTETVWGMAGVGIIAAVTVGLGFVVRKYGRR